MKRASSLGPLPTELVHMIFRLLEDNKENLLKVSVVSKVWREIALPLLFTSLSLKSSRQFHRLFKFVKSYPSLAGCVSTLSLRERVSLVSYYGMPVVNAISPTLDLPQLAKIMYQLPKLRSLVLENVAPTWSPAASKVPRWSSLKRIEVRGDVPIFALPMLLDIFTAVDEVRFGDMPLSAEDYREIVRKYDSGVRIPRLAITSNAAAMLGPLQEMIVWDALTSLTIAIGDEQYLTLLSEFLFEAARAGAPVTSLDIDLEPLVRNMVTDEECKQRLFLFLDDEPDRETSPQIYLFCRGTSLGGLSPPAGISVHCASPSRPRDTLNTTGPSSETRTTRSSRGSSPSSRSASRGRSAGLRSPSPARLTSTSAVLSRPGTRLAWLSRTDASPCFGAWPRWMMCSRCRRSRCSGRRVSRSNSTRRTAVRRTRRFSSRA